MDCPEQGNDECRQHCPFTLSPGAGQGQQKAQKGEDQERVDQVQAEIGLLVVGGVVAAEGLTLRSAYPEIPTPKGMIGTLIRSTSSGGVPRASK